jgi:hypothetical protein
MGLGEADGTEVGANDGCDVGLCFTSGIDCDVFCGMGSACSMNAEFDNL